MFSTDIWVTKTVILKAYTMNHNKYCVRHGICIIEAIVEHSVGNVVTPILTRYR